MRKKTKDRIVGAVFAYVTLAAFTALVGLRTAAIVVGSLAALALLYLALWWYARKRPRFAAALERGTLVVVGLVGIAAGVALVAGALLWAKNLAADPDAAIVYGLRPIPVRAEAPWVAGGVIIGLLLVLGGVKALVAAVKGSSSGSLG